MTIWITTNCGKFLRDGNARSPYQSSEKEFKKQQSETDMEHRTGSKLRKEYDKAVYSHPIYLIYVQNTSCKIPGWMNHKLESRLLGEISITSDMQIIPL